MIRLDAVPIDTHSRSFMKAVSYRVVGSIATMLIFFAASRDVKLSIGVGLLDTLVKIGVYFFHERLWERISFGRQRPPEYEI